MDLTFFSSRHFQTIFWSSVNFSVLYKSELLNQVFQAQCGHSSCKGQGPRSLSNCLIQKAIFVYSSCPQSEASILGSSSSPGNFLKMQALRPTVSEALEVSSTLYFNRPHRVFQYLLWCKLCWSVLEIQRANKVPRNINLRENHASSYYPDYPSDFSRVKICFIIPLTWLRTNATVWNLLFSYWCLCPARVGKYIAKEICTRAALLNHSGMGKQPAQGLQGLQERSGSVVWIWTSALFQHLLLEPPSCSRELPWALVPSTSCSSAFYLCIYFKLDSKVENSYPVPVRGQKSQRGSMLHTYIGGQKSSPSFPMVITYVK